jgi:hypothetical protein
MTKMKFPVFKESLAISKWKQKNAIQTGITRCFASSSGTNKLVHFFSQMYVLFWFYVFGIF